MISSENGLLRGTVLSLLSSTRAHVAILNVRGRDLGSFVDQAKEAIARQVQLPTGYYIA
jgi:Cu/Ag efflux pump CusA